MFPQAIILRMKILPSNDFPDPDFKVAIIIPALNEENTIEPVIRGVLPFGLVIVVDDGSTDKTASISEVAGASVVSHGKNSGYDAALFSGMSKALEFGADAAITIDADGQHLPEDIGKFVEILKNGGADIVMGVRPKPARFAEWVFRIWAKKRYGVQDILCGFKGYNKNYLERFKAEAARFSFGTALPVACIKNGARAVYLPIKIKKRVDIPRLGRALRANLLIFKAMIGVVFDAKQA